MGVDDRSLRSVLWSSAAFATSAAILVLSVASVRSDAAGPLGTFRGVNIFGATDVNQALTFETWLAQEANISVTKMAANISPAGAARGAVVASPSQKDPNYFYFWVRDAALVMNVAVHGYITATGPSKMRWQSALTDYVDFSRSNQLSPTPTGLGEPKFFADGSVFTDPWGRPQNDSPALRAITLIHFADDLLAHGQGAYVQSKLYSATPQASTVIKADLEYVSHHWPDKSFDLWEEVRGDHFYTRLVQQASLLRGSDLASKMGDPGAAAFYRQQADLIHQDIEHFWDPSRQAIVATTGRDAGLSGKNSGLDVAVILGVLHAGFTDGEFSPADDRVLSTAAQLVNSFQNLYAINDPQRFPDVATAIGRYPEDRYSGQAGNFIGNPWVLATAALAEYHYAASTQITTRGSFTVSPTNLNFVLSVVGSTLGSQPVRPGLTVARGSAEFQQLVQKIVDRGDAYLKRVRLHANPDGSLSEQIDRNSGFMVSARDLTWSYASFITAVWARP
jgi:glucoamylase